MGWVGFVVVLGGVFGWFFVAVVLVGVFFSCGVLLLLLSCEFVCLGGFFCVFLGFLLSLTPNGFLAPSSTL